MYGTASFACGFVASVLTTPSTPSAPSLPIASRDTEVEASAQVLAVLSADHQTRGGGGGAAVKLAAPWLRGPWGAPFELLASGRIGYLGGSGLVWMVEAGVTTRLQRFETWRPEASLSLLMLGGGLVRSIETNGEQAGNPWSLQLGLAPLRFALTDGWVSVLAFGAGPNLLRSGNPPMTWTAMLFEIGTSF